MAADDEARAPKDPAAASPEPLAGALRGALLVGTIAVLVVRTLVPGLAVAQTHPSVNLIIDGLPVMLLALWGLHALLRRDLPRPPTRALLPAILFLGWMAASTIWAGHKPTAYETFTGWAGVFVLAYVVHLLAADPRARGALLAVVVVLGGGIAALALKDALIEKPEARRALEEDPDLVDVPPELRAELEGRLANIEVSGPFLLSNLLAGYLILVMPLTAGLMIDAWPHRRSGRQGARLFALAVFLAMQLGCLALTGSKGGWVAAVGGAAAFLVAWRGGGLLVGPGARRWLLGGAAVATVLLGTGLFAAIPAVRRVGGTSLEIRDEYWRAARRMVAERPLLGFGAGNFQHHYVRFRPETAEETRYAHNNPLQVAVETGLVGVALLLLLAVRLAGGLGGGDSTTRPGIGPSTGLLVTLGWTLGLCLMAALGAFPIRFTDAYSLLVIAGGGGVLIVAYLLPELGGEETTATGRGLWIGAVGALVGAALHGMVDLDLYSPGILATTLVVAVLASPPRAPLRRPDRGARIGLVGGSLAVAVAVYLAYLPPMLHHDVLFQRGEDLFWDAMERGPVEREAGLRSAVEHYVDAEAAKPWSGAAPLQMGRAQLELHRTLVSAGRDGQRPVESAVASLLRARERAPGSAAISHDLAEAMSAMAAYDPYVLADVERFLKEAIDKYPTRAEYHYKLAALFFRTRYRGGGDVRALEAARLEAGRALQLHDRARVPWLRLTPEAEARCREILAEEAPAAPRRGG